MARSKKPRYLPSSLPAPGPSYKAGGYAELQKFGKGSEVKQLLLSEPEASEPVDLEVAGLDFTVSEDKAFSALQILLDSTNYQGNEQGQETYSSRFKGSYMLPRLSFTYSEYFEAYGLKKYGGRYQGAVAKEALEALRSLAEKHRTIAYKRSRYESSGKARKKVYDIIRYKGPLIEIVEGYQGLNEEEASQVMAGVDMPGRVTRLAVQFGPLVVDTIDTFYLIKPVDLHKKIEDLFGGKRYSPAVPLFVNWLLMKNRKTWQIRKEELAHVLRLDYLLEQRKPAMLQKRLEECCETAKALGYLLEYREDEYGKLLILKLNPKRCGRISSEEVDT